jgi:nucleotide-binding universal stress UspA family protein
MSSEVIMFKKLLVPLDGSSLAEQALDRATEIARAAEAELELLLVQEHVGLEEIHDAVWRAERTNEALRYLESIATRVAAASKIRVSVRVRHGEPTESICRHATEAGADLIVMTSRGRMAMTRAWFGSVADGVVNQARVPILVLRPTEAAAGTTPEPYQHVLIALDGSSFAEEVRPAALALACATRARVTLMRVVPPVVEVAADAGLPYAYMGAIADDVTTKRIAAEAKQELEAVAEQLRWENSWLEVEALVVTEPVVAQSIITHARARHVDVIAMTTHGGGVSQFLLGSVAHRVMRRSDVATLIYRPVEVRAKGETSETRAEAYAAEPSLN